MREVGREHGDSLPGVCVNVLGRGGVCMRGRGRVRIENREADRERD
jgi:hypothetical protein